MNQTQTSNISSEWELLPVDIVRIRSKLRERSDSILKLEQERLINDEERHIRAKVSLQCPSWHKSDIDFANEILKVFELKLEQQRLEVSQSFDHNGPGHANGLSYLLPQPIYDFYSKRDIKISTSDKMKLEESVRQIQLISNQYLRKKRERASDELATALQNMLSEVENEGEAMWKKEISKVTEGWKEGGNLRKAYEVTQKASWTSQEELVSQFVKEQKELAASLAVKELRKEIRKAVSSRVVGVDRSCANVAAVASVHLRNIDLYANVLDGKGGPDELDMTTAMTEHATAIQQRIDTAITTLKDISRYNMKLAAKVSILREINGQQPGDDLELLRGLLLDMI